MCEAAGHKQEVESRQEGCVVVWKTNYPHRSHLCHRIVTVCGVWESSASGRAEFEGLQPHPTSCFLSQIPVGE